MIKAELLDRMERTLRRLDPSDAREIRLITQLYAAATLDSAIATMRSYREADRAADRAHRALRSTPR